MSKRADLIVDRDGSSITITFRNRESTEKALVYKANAYNRSRSELEAAAYQDTFNDTDSGTPKYKGKLIGTESNEIINTSTEVINTSTEFIYKETPGVISSYRLTT